MRRRAILSVRANPACPDEAAAERAVNEVWESCFADTRPFDEVRVLPTGCARYKTTDEPSREEDLLDWGNDGSWA